MAAAFPMAFDIPFQPVVETSFHYGDDPMLEGDPEGWFPRRMVGAYYLGQGYP
jgi:hypothetical protein